MVDGVSQGFKKQLEIKGVGYRAQAKGGKINFYPRLLSSYRV